MAKSFFEIVDPMPDWMVMEPIEPPPVAKHEGGGHDQSSHANRGGTDMAPVRYPSSNDEEWADATKYLEDYQDEGYRINKYLRASGEASLGGGQGKSVDELDRLIAAMPPIAEDVIVYRGGGSKLRAVIDEKTGFSKSGMTEMDVEGISFTDYGFISTSTDVDVPLGFMDDYANSVSMSVRVPAGSRVLNTDKFFGMEGRRTVESEWILPRGTKFVIRSVSQRHPNTALRVVVDAVLPDVPAEVIRP